MRRMNAVYVVIENGDPYPIAYSSFASAIATVHEKYKEIIAEEKRDAYGGPLASVVDVPENIILGKTYLYIEKEIHIYIHKLPVLSF